HLSELQTDVAATENDQMLGHFGQLHDRGRIERRHLIDSLQRGPGRAATAVDEHQIGSDCPRAAPGLCRADLQLLLSGKPGIPANQIEVCGGLEPPLAAVAEAVHYRLLALPDPREVDTDRSGSDTVVSTAAGEIGHACACHHRLGRSTALVDAGPAY